MDVLVIGRNVEVLETVKRGLIAKGIAADGTIISAAVNRETGREFASSFEIIEDDGAYDMFLNVTKECDVSVERYHAKNGMLGTTLGRGHLSPGPFIFRIPEQEIYAGLNIILVALDGTEFYFHKIQR